MPSSTITTELPVPEKLQAGFLNITAPLNPTKVDLPSPGVSMSLGQVSAITSTKVSTSNLQATASSGNTSTGQDISTAQDFSDLDSLGRTKTLRTERFLILRPKSKTKRWITGRWSGQSGPS